MTDPVRLALYFGFGDGGHFLRSHRGRHETLDPEKDFPGFPWTISLLDGGLLKNRKASDHPDGRVHWTCGGRPALWLAFFWWDRSGDKRGASNSGFYVRGFEHTDRAAAFDFACAEWPEVVCRQLHPLRVVEMAPAI